MEYLALVAEIETLKEEITLLRAAKKSGRVACTGINMRGNPCKNKCVENQSWCEKHDPSLPPKVKKSKGHKHGVTVESLVPCEPCDTGGWISEAEFWAARNEPRMI